MSAPKIDIDYNTLEDHLKTLAYANRLELLSILRAPHALEDIHLAPRSGSRGGDPERNITRQAVRAHITKLVESGLVRVTSIDRRSEGKGRRSVNGYVSDHAQIFAIVEELRKLSLLQAEAPLDPGATRQLTAAGPAPWPEGPKLILVRGVHEGRAFGLRATDARPPRGWIVGRALDAAISLSYDPFVSQENAEILRGPKGYTLLDLRSARNGTFHNWQRLPPGGEVPLASGDLIGIGRSLLVFREK